MNAVGTATVEAGNSLIRPYIVRSISNVQGTWYRTNSVSRVNTLAPRTRTEEGRAFAESAGIDLFLVGSLRRT
jgi:hypothetical protein